MSAHDELPVLLTVRGTTVPPNLEAARELHNATAGSAPGIAAARALGDLSHKVYAPCSRATKLSDAKPGELLFLDVWQHAAGISEFFGNAHVQQQGVALFGAKEPAVWMPARGSFAFHLPAPAGRDERYVGILRAPVVDPEAAIAAFGNGQKQGLRDARKRGQLSHELYVKLAAPGDRGPLEILGLDTWCSLEGMLEHYGDMHMEALAKTFAGAPQASIWEQAAGKWSEW